MSRPSKSAQQAVPPTPTSWSPPSIEFNLEALPPLPPIRDPDVARQARTMKSSLSLDGTEKRELRTAELGSNERLEWRGDAAFHHHVSERLHELLPRATVGELSDLRARLTSNRTFSHLSWQYGMARELIFSQSDATHRSTREEDQRIAANAFEAYWGAILASGDSHGSLLTHWLERFLTPEVIPALTHIKKSMEIVPTVVSGVPQKRPRLETGDAARDAEHRTSSGRRSITVRSNHQWTDEFKPGQRWCSTLEIGGRIVGTGTGNKITGAREVALEQWIDTVLPAS